MKNNKYLAVWGTVTAISVAGMILPVHAADKDKDTSWKSTKTTTRTAGDRSLGHVERANKLIGKEVRTSDNQKLGKIDNLIVDLESGHVLYVLVGSGGVLGAGEKKFAIAPGAFTDARGNNVQVNFDKAKFEGAPEFSKDIDKDTELGKADFVYRVHQHFGQSAWWQGKAAPNEGTFNNVHKASDLIGMKVKNVGDQDMGKIDNLMIDLPAGRVAYVIFAPDRSLALGDNLYALPPNALTLSSDRKYLASDISKEKLTGAPHFEKGQWPDMSNPTWGGQVYKYYGKDAYFQSDVQPTSEREKERVYPEKK